MFIIQNSKKYPEACLTLDSNIRIIFASDRVKKIFGYTEEELLNKPLSLLIVDQDLEKLYNFMKRETIRDDIDLFIKLSGHKADKTVFPLQVIADRYFDEDNKQLRYILIMRDISHHAKNDEQSRLLEAEVRTIRRIYHEGEKSGNVAFWELDVKTGELIYSPNYAHIFGLKGATIKVENIINRIMPEDKILVIERMKWARENKCGWEVDYRVQTVDGYVSTIHTISIANKNNDGELTHFNGMTRLLKKEKIKWA